MRSSPGGGLLSRISCNAISPVRVLPAWDQAEALGFPRLHQAEGADAGQVGERGACENPAQSAPCFRMAFQSQCLGFINTSHYIV